MAKKVIHSGISFFERYLTLWVAICMVVGVLIGVYLPAIPELLGAFEYASVSIPVAILIWLYPFECRRDFKNCYHQ